MVRKNTCCFTGHRVLPAKKMDHILRRLKDEIDRLMQEGVTTFISGGAIGFDQMAASLIATKKETGSAIRLELALPCHDQDKFWTAKQQDLHRYLVSRADEVHYISESYEEGCMKKRNCYMVDRSAYCICALLKEGSGTGQTVRYAGRQEIQIVNVAR